MDAIALLIGDHNRVRGLFTRFKAAKEADDTETMAQVAAKIFEELDVHTTIEEEVFYPAVREKSEDLGEIVVEGIEEHNVVKHVMEECKAMDPSAEEWAAKVTVIIENVEHHAEEEESDMFPDVRSAFGAEGLATLAEQLTAKKQELGAPTADLVIDLSKEELMAKAQEQEIPGRSSMSREELALAVDPRG